MMTMDALTVSSQVKAIAQELGGDSPAEHFAEALQKHETLAVERNELEVAGQAIELAIERARSGQTIERGREAPALELGDGGRGGRF